MGPSDGPSSTRGTRVATPRAGSPGATLGASASGPTLPALVAASGTAGLAVTDASGAPGDGGRISKIGWTRSAETMSAVPGTAASRAGCTPAGTVAIATSAS